MPWKLETFHNRDSNPNPGRPVRAEFPNKLEYSGLSGGIFFYHRTEMSNICTFIIKVKIAHMCELLFFHTFKIMRIRSHRPWELISKSQRCQHHSFKMSKVMTAVGFEPTPFRTGALSQRLRPLSQTVGKSFTLLISIVFVIPIMASQVLARSCAVYLRWPEGVRHIQCAIFNAPRTRFFDHYW